MHAHLSSTQPPPMTTLLQSYEEEYRDAVKSVNDDIVALRATVARDAVGYRAPPATGSGSRVQRGAALMESIAHVRDLVVSMEYECNDLPAALRQTSRERIAAYRTDIKKLEDTLSALKADASAADRLDLLGNASKPKPVDASGRSLEGDLDDDAKKHRLQMMENTDKVKQASNTLLKAERLLNETETVGNEALTNLRVQTETMQHINETTIAVDAEISEARKVLSSMQRVMIKHKAILLAVILVLIFLIIVAIYVAVSKNRRNTPLTPTTVAPQGPTIPTSNPSIGSGTGGIPSD